MAKARLPSRLVAAYVSAIRNTPLLVIVLFVYFALPQLGIRLGKLESFVASLAVYAGAYLTEVFRAGLAGVPRGVVDAGRAIGLDRISAGALRRSRPSCCAIRLPALGTTFISLFKDTSLAAVIAVPELTYQARKLNTETFRVAEAWATASVLYLVDLSADRCGAARSSNAASRSSEAWRMQHFLHELWIARWALAQGLLLTVEISAGVDFLRNRHRSPGRHWPDLWPVAAALADPRPGRLHPRHPGPRADPGGLLSSDLCRHQSDGDRIRAVRACPSSAAPIWARSSAARCNPFRAPRSMPGAPSA